MTYQLFRAAEQHRGQAAMKHLQQNRSLKWEALAANYRRKDTHTHTFSFSSTAPAACIVAAAAG